MYSARVYLLDEEVLSCARNILLVLFESRIVAIGNASIT